MASLASTRHSTRGATVGRSLRRRKTSAGGSPTLRSGNSHRRSGKVSSRRTAKVHKAAAQAANAPSVRGAGFATPGRRTTAKTARPRRSARLSSDSNNCEHSSSNSPSRPSPTRSASRTTRRQPPRTLASADCTAARSIEWSAFWTKGSGKNLSTAAPAAANRDASRLRVRPSPTNSTWPAVRHGAPGAVSGKGIPVETRDATSSATAVAPACREAHKTQRLPAATRFGQIHSIWPAPSAPSESGDNPPSVMVSSSDKWPRELKGGGPSPVWTSRTNAAAGPCARPRLERTSGGACSEDMAHLQVRVAEKEVSARNCARKRPNDMNGGWPRTMRSRA